MKVVLDYDQGDVAVEFDRDGPVVLRRPRLREWCAWQIEHDQIGRVAVDVDAGPWFDEALDAPPERVDAAARLNVRILEALSSTPVWIDRPGHPVWLELCDRSLTAELLTFWRDFPLSPWLNAAEQPTEGVDEAKLIRSNLPGALAARAVLYKALVAHMSPLTIDELELWQIAALLGRDEQPVGSRLAGELAVEGMDDGGRIVRNGNRETRSWRRKPGAPYLFSALAPT